MALFNIRPGNIGDIVIKEGRAISRVPSTLARALRQYQMRKAFAQINHGLTVGEM